MASTWARLEGSVPVNAAAARLLKRLPDQEIDGESSAAIIARLERENLRLQQVLTYYESVSIPGMIDLANDLLSKIRELTADPKAQGAKLHNKD